MDASERVSASFMKHVMIKSLPNFILLASLLPYVGVGTENPTLDHYPLLLLTLFCSLTCYDITGWSFLSVVLFWSLPGGQLNRFLYIFI